MNTTTTEEFINRHVGLNENEITEMLSIVGVKDLTQLIDETIPASIRLPKELVLDEPESEYEFLNSIREIATKNTLAKSYIGMGYYPTILPSVIQRNILENPGWYTQYTPYQAEISQGRLEALLNFQTMVSDLTALPIANASLLDEGTATAEAMLMLHNLAKAKGRNKIYLSADIFPQTIDVVKTRAKYQNIVVTVSETGSTPLSEEYFAVVLQYPNGFGEIVDYKAIIEQAKALGIYVIFIADLLSLAILTPPGELGADVCVGSTQRFGVPMGFGGPHAAFFAAKDDFKRMIPGRIIGASVDSNGNLAYRMALQTREQHIKREKATSNICTSQVLLAIMASMYAVYHGPDGIKAISNRIHLLTNILENSLSTLGFQQVNKYYYDTLHYVISISSMNIVKKIAEAKNINFRYLGDEGLSISLDETTSIKDIENIVSVFEEAFSRKSSFNLKSVPAKNAIPSWAVRQSKYLTSPVFSAYHSETEMMRYIKRLEMKDLSLTASMIALGSCTMKLNPAAAMMPITLPEFANIHPFVPADQAGGYKIVIDELTKELCEITGFKGVSFQPNSGAQGEYTGLLVIRNYFEAVKQAHRNVVLIPSSAHGTNPASAVMAGLDVQIVNCDDNGNIDVADLKNKAEKYSANLAALMVTYPSTHGVFETAIKEICAIIHENGGQVYMDGANMNAQVGLTQPAVIGADVCHINLHKTFAIPHGGGGPGMGPICVAEHLAPYLPKHFFTSNAVADSYGAVSSAPYGSANILVISLAYIKMLGTRGLKKATEIAILNANYLMKQLGQHYKVLYTGENGRVGHELIFDCRDFKKTANVEVEDIAKRLMDYGFHAPTVSFPVHGTLMVEPTESESKRELDRFIAAMISIKNEIADIESGKADKVDNVLKNSPHTCHSVVQDEWKHDYSREQAAYPVDSLKKFKFWPTVGRINNAIGDRNLICSCNDISDYVSS
jgi:glycine dehydrogenase